MILRNMFQKRKNPILTKRIPWEGMEFDRINLTIDRRMHNLFSVKWEISELGKSLEISDAFTIEYNVVKYSFNQETRFCDAGVLIDLLSNPIISFHILTNARIGYEDEYEDILLSFKSGHKLILNEHTFEGFEESWHIDHGGVIEWSDLGGYGFGAGWKHDDCTASIVFPALLHVDKVTISTTYGIDLHISGGYASEIRDHLIRIYYPFEIKADNVVHRCGSHNDIKQLAKYLPDAYDNVKCKIVIDDNQRLNVVHGNSNQLVSQEPSVNTITWSVYKRVSTSLDYPDGFNPDEYSIPISNVTVE